MSVIKVVICYLCTLIPFPVNSFFNISFYSACFNLVVESPFQSNPSLRSMASRQSRHMTHSPGQTSSLQSHEAKHSLQL